MSHSLHPLSTGKPLQTQFLVQSVHFGFDQKVLSFKSARCPDRSGKTIRWLDGVTHLQGVPDGQQSVLSVLPLSLAGGAKVVVGTNGALEPHSHNRPFTAVTGDVRVQGGGRAVMWSMRGAMGWWVSKHERG